MTDISASTIEVVIAHLNGQEIEFKGRAGPVGGHVWRPAELGTTTLDEIIDCAGNGRFRIKPKLVPVDMSVLVDSGVDCEFLSSTGTILLICKLAAGMGAASQPYRSGVIGGCFSQCRPRMNHWHSTANCGESGPDVVLRLRDAGFNVEYDASDAAFYIVADKALCDGRCWPWDATP